MTSPYLITSDWNWQLSRPPSCILEHRCTLTLYLQTCILREVNKSFFIKQTGSEDSGCYHCSFYNVDFCYIQTLSVYSRHWFF